MVLTLLSVYMSPHRHPRHLLLGIYSSSKSTLVGCVAGILILLTLVYYVLLILGGVGGLGGFDWDLYHILLLMKYLTGSIVRVLTYLWPLVDRILTVSDSRLSATSLMWHLLID